MCACQSANLYLSRVVLPYLRGSGESTGTVPVIHFYRVGEEARVIVLVFFFPCTFWRHEPLLIMTGW
jgi:hypothetical protein